MNAYEQRIQAEATTHVDAAESALRYLEGDQGALVTAVIALTHATLAHARFTDLLTGVTYDRR